MGEEAIAMAGDALFPGGGIVANVAGGVAMYLFSLPDYLGD